MGEITDVQRMTYLDIPFTTNNLQSSAIAQFQFTNRMRVRAVQFNFTVECGTSGGTSQISIELSTIPVPQATNVVQLQGPGGVIARCLAYNSRTSTDEPGNMNGGYALIPVDTTFEPNSLIYVNTQGVGFLSAINTCAGYIRLHF